MDISGKTVRAMEIAQQVLRLCYPLRALHATHVYYNNAPVEPFLSPEHTGLKARTEVALRMGRPIKEHLVFDVYFFWKDERIMYNMDNAFVVEVVFPEGAQRARWDAIIRVRWADLGWPAGDAPFPLLVGETFVNDWM